MKHNTENRRNDNVPVQQRLCHQHDVFQDRHSAPPSRSSVMIGDSQLAKVNDPGMQPCSATTVEHACARCQDQTGALHMFCDTNESESCLDKAPAKHSDESVPVVGDLLCDGTEKTEDARDRRQS